MPAPPNPVRLEMSVMVPMRDGVKLSTDLYMPEGSGGPLPVILVRTPYNKNTHRQEGSAALFFARHGYVVAVQDVRGKYESGGSYIVSADDPQDGDDAVTWLAAQPWSTGKVGTYGCSYLGETQMQLATRRNPHHAAMIPQAAGGSYRYAGFVTAGAMELGFGFWWFREFGGKVHPQFPPGTAREHFLRAAPHYSLSPALPEIDYGAIMHTLPLIDMMARAGAPPTDWEGFVAHEPTDPWWDQFNYIKETDTFDIPALHVNTWYDYGVDDTLRLFNLLRTNSVSAHGRDHQFVVIAPGIHCRAEQACEHTMVGERDLGDARFDGLDLYLRWFDYWLKGLDNGVTGMPRIQLYVMGKNEWRAENEWPLARTRFTDYYLHSEGTANSRFGTGTLSTVAPGDEPPDHFVYDPMTPVPTIGGAICGCFPSGAFDQSEIETRYDVLVYSTPALEQGLEVTGPLAVTLYVSSTARDTDFTAKLIDVYPDGTAYNLQEGIARARYREGFDKKVWMMPGEVYEVTVDLFVTSNYFAPGHRIRLEVSSSNFPRFDRNLNTGGNNYEETEWIIARNTIHHSRRYPSHVRLPVIP